MNTCKKRRDVIYILAQSYTGSTLLTFLLAQHPRIATIGELKATARGDLDQYYCSCGMLQKECDFWQQVATEMQKYDSSFSLEDFGTHFRSKSYFNDRLIRAGIKRPLLERLRSILLGFMPGCRCRLNEVLKQNRILIDVICDLQEKDIFLDSSKDPIRLKWMQSSDYWNVKVIYLIRDGRGATNSFIRHHSTSMVIAAKEWGRTHHECDRIVRELMEDTWITVFYEDLCRDPAKTLEKIFDFLELPLCMGDQSSDQHIMGNQMRLKSIEAIQLDEKWKEALSKDDLMVFTRIAGRLNLCYGYSDRY